MTDSDNPQPEPRYRIGNLIFDPGNRGFVRDGRVEALPNLSFKLLDCLIRHAPNTVAFDQLIEEVWGETIVSPETLTQRVKLLRDAIGDDHQNPRYIETKRGYGYRLIPTVEPMNQVSKESTKRNRFVLASVAVAVAVAVIVLGFLYSINAGRFEESGEMLQSIAVLPFANLSSDPDQEYFSDGLSDELINMLTKVPGLHVVARASSFTFKGEKIDIPTIANKLRVSHVLDGSVRKTGDDIRTTVQLINAEDGYHLWSETYDHTLDDIFAIQSEIAESVANALKITLLGESLAMQQTSSDVYNFYLKARYFDNLKGKENWEKAVKNYQQALDIDPDFAPGWAGLSVTYHYQANARLRDFNDGMTMARDAVQRALELDENLAIAWASLGQIELLDAWNWSAADKAIQKALQLEPGNADVLAAAAWPAGVQGRQDEVIELLQRAIALDPLSQSPRNGLGLAYMKSGRLDEAETVFRELLELNPQYPWGYVNLGRVQMLKGEPQAALLNFERSKINMWRESGLVLALGELGRSEEAAAVLATLESKYAEGGAFQIAAVHAWRGDIDQAFHWLQRSLQARNPGLIFVPTDPFVANLHDDPRWSVFLEELQLPHLESQL